MAEPRNGKLAGTILWSDGSNFSGFAIIGLVVPTASGTAWPELAIDPGSPRQRIPLWITCPIKAGTFNNQIGLWYTDDIDPPNSKYCVYFYDTAMKQVGAPATSADFFTVSSAYTTIVAPTLTVPIAGTVIPVPNS